MAKNRKTPDMNLPVWFDGQNINEALFCEEFLQESRIIFANRAFFTPNGRVTDDIFLRGEVYEKLKSYTISSVPQKIKNIMELLKLLVPVALPVPFSFYFDIFDGLIQAYVFVFLTSMYIKEAIE